MNDFDKTYTEILETIEEGKLKGLATAGLLGLGALTSNAHAGQQATPRAETSVQQTQQTQQAKKARIVRLRELKILAQQAIANNDESGLRAIEAEVQRILKG